ncbi:MAG: hypothetical protein J7621_24990 [Niastella sp.]|nr:hypothetical protein [Niastella sp.]
MKRIYHSSSIISMLLGGMLVAGVPAVAQTIQRIDIQTVKVNPSRVPIVNRAPYQSKAANADPAPDTMKLVIKADRSVPGSVDKTMTVAQYTARMRKIEQLMNQEGFTLTELQTIQTPLNLYKPVKRIDFTPATKGSFSTTSSKLSTKKTALQLNQLAFKNRKLPGLEVKMIPAYKLNRATISDFKKANPGKVAKSGNTYTLIKTIPMKPGSIVLPATTPKTSRRREDLPLFEQEGNNEVLFSVNASGYLESTATAYPINKPIDEVTLDDLKDTRSSNTVKGGIEASARIDDRTIPVMSLSIEYGAMANRNEQHYKKVGLLLGGQQLMSANSRESFSGDDQVVTDRFEKTVDIPLAILTMPVGIGRVQCEWGISGGVSLDVNGEMHRGLAGLQIKPSARLDVYGEAKAGIGFGDFDFIAAYIRPELRLVTIELDNYAESSLNWANTWQLYNDVSSTGTIEMLKGYLHAGVRVGYPDIKWCAVGAGVSMPCGTVWRQLDFRVTLWDSGDGLVRANKTFIDSDPTELFFDDWR